MNKIFRAIIFCLAVFAGACSDNTYDKHYEADPAIVSENNLWTTIEAMPELSKFTGILKGYGYDQILSQTQAYTVFAPDNAALSALDTTNMDVLKELVENHIARFILPVPGRSASVVATLNGKRIILSWGSNNYFFGSAAFAVPTQSVIASNGIVHVLDNYDVFFPNVYEYLSKGAGLDSIKDFLYSFDELLFYPEASVPGSIVDGQQTYLDSVFYNYNSMLDSIGYINREDSSYIMIVPDNAAWIEAYDRVKNDYAYYNKNAAKADSMQRMHTAYALIQDLVFNLNEQESSQDSLVSTTRNTFYNPQYLFDGAQAVSTSNGTVFVTGQLKYKAYESWQPRILVEAERVLGRTNTLSTPSVVRVTGDAITLISGGQYLKLDPTTSSGNPTVTFEIPNTLSSYYDIYCVFVSTNIATPGAQGLKPCKVYFNLSYVNANGTTLIDRFPATGDIETNPNRIDTVLVVSDFKFPTANYNELQDNGDPLVTVTLKVISDVARTETTNYNRQLLLDCILLEPKKQ